MIDLNYETAETRICCGISWISGRLAMRCGSFMNRIAFRFLDKSGKILHRFSTESGKFSVSQFRQDNMEPAGGVAAWVRIRLILRDGAVNRHSQPCEN
jgi:hypothetical protein